MPLACCKEKAISLAWVEMGFSVYCLVLCRHCRGACLMVFHDHCLNDVQSLFLCGHRCRIFFYCCCCCCGVETLLFDWYLCRHDRVYFCCCDDYDGDPLYHAFLHHGDHCYGDDDDALMLFLRLHCHRDYDGDDVSFFSRSYDACDASLIFSCPSPRLLCRCLRWLV